MSTPVNHPGNMYLREQEHVAALKAAYPHQFPQPAWSYRWPDGWHPLVVDACAGLAHHLPAGSWLQIKEKFGGLRLYHRGGPRRFDLQTPVGIYTGLYPSGGEPIDPSALTTLIFALEETSRETCCLCGGANGVGRAVLFPTSWWLTTCQTCQPLISAYRALNSWSAES